MYIVYRDKVDFTAFDHLLYNYLIVWLAPINIYDTVSLFLNQTEKATKSPAKKSFWSMRKLIKTFPAY